MINRDPEKNFEHLWQTFYKRYPFFELRRVDWKNQYAIYRSKVTNETSDEELFDIFCEMLGPLNDGHVELQAKLVGERRKRFFSPERTPKFWQEFTKRQIKQLFKITGETASSRRYRNASTRAGTTSELPRATRLFNAESDCADVPKMTVRLCSLNCSAAFTPAIIELNKATITTAAAIRMVMANISDFVVSRHMYFAAHRK